ncbi:MAG: 2,3-bisphosphoglycerate-independent phosphoglycerate mutase [Alphaproteobacteria bacterium]
MEITSPSDKGPVVLCILDGWGDRRGGDDNAIAAAGTPVLDRLLASSTRSQLDASEGFVGLPSGQMGNSEVGHMNIGAGRVVLQDLPQINLSIESGEFINLPVLRETIVDLKQTGGIAHIAGLLSPGGVHSHQDHIAAVVELFQSNGIPVAVHAFLDGRDCPPSRARAYVEQFETAFPGAIKTVCGRYFAMDRDNKWGRTKRAFDLLTTGHGDRNVPDAITAVTEAYAAGETDEFVQPTSVGGFQGMRDGDALVMMNFRADRARQIMAALIDPSFDKFDRKQAPDFCHRISLTEYSEALTRLSEVLFPPADIINTLGDVVSRNGLRQLRIAETEKYAHVTFFLNGGREDTLEGEDRVLIPSPDVATYDLQPEMSANELTDELVARIKSGMYALIVVNYANPDMVGHTGVFDAAVKAVETVDACIGRVQKALAETHGVLLVTADHGNIEMMKDPTTGAPHTAHTINRVPFAIAGIPDGTKVHDGRLADIAPTVLTLMGLPIPDEMTGNPLLGADSGRQAAE